MGLGCMSRSIPWQRHLIAIACLALALGLVGSFLADDLIGAGISHDPIFQTLTHNRQRDYLRRLADLLQAGDFEAAYRYVGPPGYSGLTDIRREIERGGGSYHVSQGSQRSDGDGSFGALFVEVPATSGGGEPTTLSKAFLLDLRFEKGSWRLSGIRRYR